MTALFAGDSQVGASLPPFDAVGQNPAPAGAKLGERLIEARSPPAMPASVGRDGIDDPTETA